MESKARVAEKIFVLVVLIVLGVILNSISPVSIKDKGKRNVSYNIQNSQKNEATCQKSSDDLLSILLNNTQNDSSCLFIGCGSAF